MTRHDRTVKEIPMRHETGCFPSTETGQRCGYAESVSLKHFIFSLLVTSAFLAIGCGSSIHDAQNFSPNEAPVIENVSSSTTSGSVAAGIKKGMMFTITVTAHDPDRQKISYDFISDYGTFGPITVTATGCTVSFLTNGFVESGKPVTVKMNAKDTEGASAATSYNVGTGKRGPLVEVTFAMSRFIQSKNYTEISVKSNCEGIYQIYCDNGIASDGTGAGMRTAYDYFRYKKNSDGSFKSAKAVIAGATRGGTSDVKLTSDQQANKIWVVFSDGINEPVAALAEVVVDDVAPSIASITPGGTDCGVRSEINIIFKEPVFYQSGSIEVSNTYPGNPSADFTPSSAGLSIILTPKNDMNYYETYTVSVDGDDVEIVDRAGNKYVGSNSSSFTTQAAGQLAKPEFRNTDNSAVNGTVPYAYNADNQSIKAVYTGSETGTSVVITSSKLSAAAPSDPPIDYTKTSATTFDFKENMQLKAVAFKRGYKPSVVSTVSVRMKTKTPELIISGHQKYPPSSYTGVLVYPTGTNVSINLKETYPGGTVKYTIQNISFWDLPIPEPGNPKTASPTNVNPWEAQSVSSGCRQYALVAQTDNMDESDVYMSPVYRIRPLTLVKSDLSVPEVYVANKEGYAIATTGSPRSGGLNWKEVAMDTTGQHIAAIETSTYVSGLIYIGYIWLSDDYGLTWIKQTGGDLGTTGKTWKGISISGDGTKIIACANEDYVYYYNESSWQKQTIGGTLPKNWADVSISRNGLHISAVIWNGVRYYAESSTLTWLNDIQPGPYQWKSISVSDNENVIMAPANNYMKYFNGSWNPINFGMPIAGWNKCVISSENGSFMAAVTNVTGIYRTGSLGWENVTIDGLLSFTSLSMSKEGTYIFSAPSSGQLYFSIGSGAAGTWNQISTSESAGYSDISTNGDGKLIAAAVGSGDILIGSIENTTDWSSPYVNWSHQGVRTWTGVACSSDGKFIAACDGGASGHGGYIYIYNNDKWTEHKEMGQKKWRSISMSKDGIFLAAISDKEYWSSTDKGATWTCLKILSSLPTASSFTKVSVSGTSGDSAKAVVITDSPYHYIFGKTSVIVNGSNIIQSAWSNIVDVKVSDDANFCLFLFHDKICKVNCASGAYSTLVYPYFTSTDYWTHFSASADLSKIYMLRLNTSPYSNFIDKTTDFSTIAISSTSVSDVTIHTLLSSADGNLLAFANSTGIQTSVNGGSSWDTQSATNFLGITCLDSTSDGLTIFAGGTKQRNITVLK